MYEYVLII